MALPSTGGSTVQVIQPGWDPLKVRYGQIVAVFIRDYLDTNGQPRNLSDPACGVGIQGVFTPFAADNLTVREDLLWSANGGTSNQGWFNVGLTKEDSVQVDSTQTVQQTPTGQTLRSVRNVYTKLEDKVMFSPLENSNLIKRLRWNLPLTGWTPDDGVPGYQLLRGETDVFYERQVIQFLIDTDNQLLAEVYPRVGPDKTGKVEFGRKTPYGPESIGYDVLPDPYTGQSMWICEAGATWNSEADSLFETTVPAVTPITGLKATVLVPTPAALTSPTYTVSLQSTAGGSWSAGTVTTPSPSNSNGWTTVTIGSLSASTAYNALKITATASGESVTTPPSAPFTSTSS
jgi:hypothetical protein